jgi:hypothetical protein
LIQTLRKKEWLVSSIAIVNNEEAPIKMRAVNQKTNAIYHRLAMPAICGNELLRPFDEVILLEKFFFIKSFLLVLNSQLQESNFYSNT